MDKTVISEAEEKFVTASMQTGVRTDGRPLIAIRPIHFKLGDRWGECELSWGATKVFCTVNAELVEPYADRASEGMLSFFVELSPMACQEFDKHKPDLAVELTRMLERSLRDSRAVDREALCVAAYEKVWNVRCDVHVIDNGGNLVDACNLAALIALMHFRRRDSIVRGEETIIFSEEEREPVPLSIHYLPVSITFAFFDQGTIIAVDPTDEEEAVMEGRLTVTMNNFKDVCGMQKNGGVALDPDVILQCVTHATIQAEQIHDLITTEINAYTEKRLKGRGCISMPPPKKTNDDKATEKKPPKNNKRNYWSSRGHTQPIQKSQASQIVPEPAMGVVRIENSSVVVAATGVSRDVGDGVVGMNATSSVVEELRREAFVDPSQAQGRGKKARRAPKPPVTENTSHINKAKIGDTVDLTPAVVSPNKPKKNKQKNRP